MSKYYKRDEGYFPVSESTYEAMLDKLPPGNYVIKQSMSGLYFSKYDKDFSITGKVYGNAIDRAVRIISTFLDRAGSTGILLSGEKGSGKTMLGKLICQMLAQHHGVPTIFITEPWNGDAFLDLIGSIKQPAVIFIDEVEKVYDGKQSEAHGSHSQVNLLTLLDGIFTTQKLYIMTCNDKYKIDEHLINRPGRIYYAFDYSGLEEEFIREYCEDNLDKQVYTEDVVRVASFFKHFNFDMLKAIVEEVNRYDEKPQESLDYLNINPASDYNEYAVSLIPAGLTAPLQKVHPASIQNPLTQKSGKFSFYTYEELTQSYLAARNGKQAVLPTPEQPVGATAKQYLTQGIEDDFDEVDADNPNNPRDPFVTVHFNFSSKDIIRTSNDGYELQNAMGDRLLLKKEEFKVNWKAL